MSRSMQPRSVRVFAVTMLFVVPNVGLSQWVHYPTDGIPRKADGTPNLTGPAPRLSDGKPDFSGLWHAAQRKGCNPDTSRFLPCGSEIGGSAQAFNYGAGMSAACPTSPGRRIW